MIATSTPEGRILAVRALNDTVARLGAMQCVRAGAPMKIKKTGA